MTTYKVEKTNVGTYVVRGPGLDGEFPVVWDDEASATRCRIMLEHAYAAGLRARDVHEASRHDPTMACVDATPAIRCTPATGCVFKTSAGLVLTIDPLDGGDCPTVNLSDVRGWLDAHDPDEPASYRCKLCGAPSWVDPSDQVPPADGCHPVDHGEPGTEWMHERLALTDQGKRLALVVWPGEAWDRSVVRVDDEGASLDAMCTVEDVDGKREQVSIPRRRLRRVPKVGIEAREQLSLGQTYHGPYAVDSWADVPDGGLARSASGMWVVRRRDQFDVVKGYAQNRPGGFDTPRFDDPDTRPDDLYTVIELDELAREAKSTGSDLPAIVVDVLAARDQTPRRMALLEQGLDLSWFR